MIKWDFELEKVEEIVRLSGIPVEYDVVELKDYNWGPTMKNAYSYMVAHCQNKFVDIKCSNFDGNILQIEFIIKHSFPTSLQWTFVMEELKEYKLSFNVEYFV